jgi:hypothetical protein
LNSDRGLSVRNRNNGVVASSSEPGTGFPAGSACDLRLPRRFTPTADVALGGDGLETSVERSSLDSNAARRSRVRLAAEDITVVAPATGNTYVELGACRVS